MPLPINHILGILSDNLMKRKSVLPISGSYATSWAKGLKIPRGGETVIYTGHMYQLIPMIEAMAGQMAMLEETPITKLMGIGRAVNKVIDLTMFMGVLASGKTKERCDNILRSIALLLREAGVEFGYLYEKELYSGALVYDQGIDDTFREHAKKVFEMFRENGVKNVITVDPHTTNMLNEVYHEFVDGYELNVRSYLEVLAERGLATDETSEETVTIHDSCVYARYENVVESPRELLKMGNVKVIEPELSGKITHCCGGPIESLFPAEAHRITKQRVDGLLEKGNKHVVTMCPICMLNIQKACPNDAKVSDIAEVLRARKVSRKS
jgi:Fe-S oxidoreductase